MVIKIVKSPQEIIEREGYGYKTLPKLDLAELEIIKQFEESHTKTKRLVQEILEYYPLATNNDFVLYTEYLRVSGLLEVTSGKDNFVLKIPRMKIRFIPSPESITRARRSLNAKGIGLPTNKAVFIRRMKRQTAIKQYFRENV